ncbi:PREDICTED: uncharacterized protein LOC109168902 [Ipomoea nil]|uniref:uncharacterized protein LOC109168902 n=1 Tax=Ipomoea nil TaxID=35883 RepID=UPI000900E101|nr:PREDICTED: uncharacterized protein LOC109168902 [Ipomoea nil]
MEDDAGVNSQLGFSNWMFREGFIDMGYEGAKFTWCRGINSTSYRAQPKNDGNPWRFKYNAAWATHPGFMEFVKSNWNSNVELDQCKNELAAKFRCWNKSTFGNIFHRKRRVLARLEGVQNSLTYNHRSDLIKLGKMLQKELEEILFQEELFWFQKSREDWISSGDRNTRYYHAASAARKSRSRITRIKNEQDVWLLDEDEVMSHICNYFTQLFIEDNQGPRQVFWSKSFPTLQDRN